MSHRLLRFGQLSALALGVGLTSASLGTWVGRHEPNHVSRDLSLGLPTFSSPREACAAHPATSIATLAIVASGHTATELHARGYSTAAALVPTLNEVVRGRDAVAAQTSDAIVLYGAGVKGVGDVQALQTSGLLTSVAPLLGQSTNPTYRTCDYRLADNPSALALLHKAATSMVSAGLLTENELDAPSSIYMVSDNPFTPNDEYVTVLLEKPVPMTAGGQGMPPESQLVTPIVAEVNAASGVVKRVGFGNWYLGQ